MNKIMITFPDGSKKEFESGITGGRIAESISRGLAKNALSVSVNGEVWDLARPITHDARSLFTHGIPPKESLHTGIARPT